MHGVLGSISPKWSSLETKEEMEDALETYNLKLTKEEMDDKIKYHEMKNEDIRKLQKFLEEMNLEECSIAMRVKSFMVDCPGNMRARYNGREDCLRCKLKPEFQGPAMRETDKTQKLTKHKN